MSSHEALFDVIGELARKRHRTAEERFAEVGLTHSEARILTVLDQLGGVASQDQVAERIHLDRTNTGRALVKLEATGHVAKVRDEKDRRANNLALTPPGRNLVADLNRLRREIAASFLGGAGGDAAAKMA